MVIPRHTFSASLLGCAGLKLPFYTSKAAVSARAFAGYSTDRDAQTDDLKPPATRLTHVHPTDGSLNMVNVSAKPTTLRRAVARGRVQLHSAEAFRLVRTNALAKGDVLTVARIAGIQGAKLTPQLIPLCHPIALSDIQVRLKLNGRDEEGGVVEIEAQAECADRTGVEMEALSAVAVAGLTVIDMCKSVARAAMLTDIRVVYKAGGRSGTYSEARSDTEQ
ncbi:hypothetical protein IWQ60_010312 [Tieghemiomyces parasiticus]|uniref:cyclic pyranopterin monophosphate synthase n=1 Tax=Tieghemiomyces parasiticus TaxID=78921 RepID=A0A9W8DIL5_9FUNG|nr:hypothetical protein IWQ60_010312 [Tieghemiomyces parasiticus]